MRALPFLAFILLASCSSSEPKLNSDSSASGQSQASKLTDSCLDNPELAKAWGECNVKSTVFQASEKLEKCRLANLDASTTVNYEIKILGNGKVKSVKPLGGRHGKHTNCVSRVFRKLQFAAPGKESIITVPYQIEP
jgi:hypothetical protein